MVETRFATAYEWRGMRLDDGAVVQGSLSARHGAGGLFASGGVAFTVDLSTDSASATGLPGGGPRDVQTWLEVGVGDPWFGVSLGLVGHRSESPDLPRRDRRRPRATTELYAEVRSPVPLGLPGFPLILAARAHRDLDDLRDWYAELAIAKRVPFTVGRRGPAGSVYLVWEGGLAHLRPPRRGEPTTATSADLFAESGWTHVRLRVRTELLPLSLAGVYVSPHAEASRTWGRDAETRRVGYGTRGRDEPARTTLEIGVRLGVPRCLPDRELCQGH